MYEMILRPIVIYIKNDQVLTIQVILATFAMHLTSFVKRELKDSKPKIYMEGIVWSSP